MKDKVKSYLERFNQICDKIYDTFISFVRKHVFIIASIILVVLSFIIRWCFIYYTSGDMYHALIPWMEALKQGGGFLALKYYPTFPSATADYPLAYFNLLALMSYLPIDSIISIKLISFFFDYALAFGVFLVVKKITNKNSLAFLTFYIMLFMPTGILNSALWGQCESIWACYIVYAIYFILKNKNIMAMFLIGISLATKLQTVFFLPTIVWLFLARKVKLREMILIPIGVFITFIPGLLFGASFSEAIKMYFTQMGKYPNANYGSANMYAFLQFGQLYDYFNNGASILFALSILGIVLVFLFHYKKGVPFTFHNFIYVTTLYAILTPYVMPHMHERYFFFADVMMILYVIITKRRKFLPITMQLASFFCYTNFLFGHYEFSFLQGEDIVMIASLINLFNIYILIKDFKFLEVNEEQAINDEEKSNS